MAGRSADTSQAPRSIIEVPKPPPLLVLGVLVAVLAALLLLDLVGRALGLESAEILSLDGEKTIPTWWASLQLVLLAVVLLLAARMQQARSSPSVFRTLTVGAAVAVFFSIDETAGIHELITATFKGKAGVPAFNGDHGVWIFLYGIAAVVLFIIALPGIAGLVRTDRANAIRFAVGAVMLVTGGVVIEIVGYSSHAYGEVLIEETFEFLGVAVMIWAVLRMIAEWDISIARPRSEDWVLDHEHRGEAGA